MDLFPAPERAKELVDLLPIKIAIIDVEARFVWANKTFVEWLGLPADQIINQHANDVLRRSDDSERLRRETLEQILSDRQQRDYTVSVIHPLRGLRTLSARLIPHENKSYIYAFMRDVTEEKDSERKERHLEEEVRRNHRLIGQMFDLSSDLFCMLDDEGRFLTVSPGFEQIAGASAGDVTGGMFVDFIDEEDRAVAQNIFRAAQSGKATTSLDIRMTNARTGVVRYVSWNGRSVPEDNQVIMIGRDVTEDRIFDEKLRQTQKMEAIGQLTGGIAHDFNNLLAAISGSLEMMNKRIEQNKPELIGKYVSAAQQASHRAAQLTQRLLAFSRRQSLAPVPVCANDLITSMQDLFDRSVGPSISLKTNLPHIWCTMCDPNQLENGLLNCIINSRDAMPEGGTITISTQNVEPDHCAVYDVPADEYVLISVKDNGSGMPQDVIDRAFDPFYTTKPIGKGTGLGLSMLYGFVNQSNGHIKIVSKVGRGTTIRIFLPRYAEEMKPEIVSVDDQIDINGTPEQTILVVEDEPLVRDVLVELMQSCGFTTLQAGDADEAMPYVANRKQRIDLLLSDVGLPGINGRQLAELARQHRPDVKVLFITGFAPSATLRDQFLAEGMDMMTKPFEVDAVAERVARMLRD